MGFRFQNLDETTRSYMVQEVERDLARGAIYLSPRLTERGRLDWPELLLAAVRSGDDVSLAERLRGTGRLKEVEYRRSTSRRGWGRSHEVRVPVTAPMTLSEGEFNRYYIRGLCLRAIASGITEVVVYRAKSVDNPRPESRHLVGQRRPAAALLEDLRIHSGEEEPAMRVPGGPNSGLSVRLPNEAEPSPTPRPRFSRAAGEGG